MSKQKGENQIVSSYSQHYQSDIIMGAMASQIYSTVYSDADQRKHQSSCDRWILHTDASKVENVFIWWRHNEIVIHWVIQQDIDICYKIRWYVSKIAISTAKDLQF